MTPRPVPERSGPPRAWDVLGALLPKSVRTRVYDPCCLDLWRHYRTTSRHRRWRALTMAVHLAGYLLAGLWYAVPDYLGEGKRWTRLRRAVSFILLGLVIASLLPWIVHLAAWRVGS